MDDQDTMNKSTKDGAVEETKNIRVLQKQMSRHNNTSNAPGFEEGLKLFQLRCQNFEQKLARIKAVTRSVESAVEEIVKESSSILQESEKLFRSTHSELEHHWKMYHDEVEKMSRMSAPKGDVVRINCGGEIFQTRRSTLCSIPGTMLDSLFSGRWDKSLEYDKDGNVFLDINPAFFRKILDFLRSRTLAGSEKADGILLPKVSTDEQADFNVLLDYLGLSPREFSQTLINTSLVPDSQAMEISDDSLTVTNVQGGPHWVISEGWTKRNFQFKYSLQILKLSGVMVFGVISSLPQNPESYFDATCFAFTSHKDGRAFSNGISRVLTPLDFIEGDEIKLILNPDDNFIMYFNPRTNQKAKLSLSTPNVSWRLYINLNAKGDSVRLVSKYSSPL